MRPKEGLICMTRVVCCQQTPMLTGKLEMNFFFFCLPSSSVISSYFTVRNLAEQRDSEFH